MESIDDYVDENETKTLCYHATDRRGNYLRIKFKRTGGNQSELMLLLCIDGGRIFYELPEHPNTVITQQKDEWSALGLKLTVLEKDKRARITFNGLLRRSTRANIDVNSNVDDSIEHVRLNFIFVASSRPRLGGGQRPLENVLKLTKKSQVDQYGSMMGLVRLQTADRSQELFLRGIRQSFVGNFDKSGTSRLTLIGMDENGSTFCLYSQDKGKKLSTNKSGHMKDLFENFSYIDSSKMSVEKFLRRMAPDDVTSAVEFKFKIPTNYEKIQLFKTYRVRMSLLRGTKRTTYGGYPWTHQATYWLCDMELNGVAGIGLIELIEPYHGICPVPRPAAPSTLSTLGPMRKDMRYNVSHVIRLGHPRCKLESLCGEKVAALAQLIHFQSIQFEVPRGFCVTTHAFECFLKANEKLSFAIDELIRSFQTWAPPKCGVNPDVWPERKVEPDITPILKKIAEAFENAVMPAETEQNIRESLSGAQEIPSIKWAVRSSAYEEDPEQIFEYGELETTEVCATISVIGQVRRVWASLFTRRSVEHRRRSGIPLRSPVAVLVQKVVDNPSGGGVLYTREPETGDPREMHIKSNCGDRVIVRRGSDDALIVVRDWPMQSQSEQRRRELSIGESVALRLARIGLDIDRLYDSAREIEWSWTLRPQDKIYLLRCRPAASSLDSWTDFELTHELGSGVPADKDMLTFAEAEEVFPQVVTPLTCTTVLETLAPSTFASAIRCFDHDDDEPDKSALFVANMRVAFNYYNLVIRNREETIDLGTILRDIGFCGRAILTQDVHEDSKKRNGVVGAVERFKLERGRKLDVLNSTEAKLREMETYVRNGQNRLEGLQETPMSRLDEHLAILREASRRYGHFSRVAIARQVEIMKLVSSGRDDFPAPNFADMTRLMGSGRHVISAQVPKLLDSMHWDTWHELMVKFHLYQVSIPQFRLMDDSQMEQWIRRYGSLYAFYDMYHFVTLDGQIGPNEFELESEPHVLKPERIYRIVQFLHDQVKKIAKRRISRNEPERYMGLPDPPSPLKLVQIESPIPMPVRKRIGALLPEAQLGVERREHAKTLLVRAAHGVRDIYATKAIQLVNEGKLPDEKLIYYLTRWEVSQLVEAPRGHAVLVHKAQRRRRVFKLLNEDSYALVNYGMPRPAIPEELPEEVNEVGHSNSGLPIFSGVVSGRVFVAERFEDDLQRRGLQMHDILVVPHIDVGWSQYFPILSGIIAERGSLLSHGAVIARNYKIPCIMGVANATRIYKTGDEVLLRGITGKIKKTKVAGAGGAVPIAPQQS